MNRCSSLAYCSTYSSCFHKKSSLLWKLPQIFHILKFSHANPILVRILKRWKRAFTSRLMSVALSHDYAMNLWETLSEGDSARLKFETVSSLVSSYVMNAQKLCPILPWNSFFDRLKIRWCQHNLIDAPYFLLGWHWWQYSKRLFDQLWEVTKSG